MSIATKAQNSEQRSLPPFTGIEILNNSKVSLHPGTEQSVRVETEDELSEVKTTVDQGVLQIKGKSSKVYISIPQLNVLSINGG